MFKAIKKRNGMEGQEARRTITPEPRPNNGKQSDQEKENLLIASI